MERKIGYGVVIAFRNTTVVHGFAALGSWYSWPAHGAV